MPFNIQNIHIHSFQQQWVEETFFNYSNPYISETWIALLAADG